jgi:4-hydroxymandelate oxidase
MDKFSQLLQTDDFEKAARELLPLEVYDYFAGGADDEVTLRRNRSCFEQVALWPRVLTDMALTDCQTSLFGKKISAPFFIAPTAFHKLAHPQGELATAKAARAFGTLHVVSTAASFSLEEIAREEALRWAQLSVQASEDWNRAFIRRAEEAGFSAIVVTVDNPVYGNRLRNRRNGFQMPAGVYPANFEGPREGDPFTYPERLTWELILELKSRTRLPFLLKGILSPADSGGLPSMERKAFWPSWRS